MVLSVQSVETTLAKIGVYRWALADSVGSDYTVVKIYQYTGLQQYTVTSLYSTLSFRNAFVWLPYFDMACFLGVREIKKKTTAENNGRINQ